jgi:drug/metabolite transporter (DMT)-like permease
MASLSSVPFLVWQEPDCLRCIARLDAKAWAGFAFLSIFMYGVSMLLFFRVLKHVPVTVAAASFYLLPVFGVLLAIVVVGERMSAYQAVGAIIVLTSTITIMKYDSKS